MSDFKKGFTLIELLAVIVVLIIILLIVVPSIINLMSEARKKAFEASAYGLIKSAENNYMRGSVTGDVVGAEYTFVEYQIQEEDGLDHTGRAPKNGKIVVRDDGKIAIGIHDGTWCATKGFLEDKVILSRIPKENCRVPGSNSFYLTLISDPIGSGYVFGSATYEGGDTVNILAEPYLSNTFIEWVDEDDQTISLNAEYSFEMPSENITLIAKFSGTDRIPESDSYTLTLKALPSYVADYLVHEGTYSKNTTALINLTRNSGFESYEFWGWYDEIGNLVSTTEMFGYKMTRDTVLTAVFDPDLIGKHSLVLKTNPSDAGYTVGSGVYDANQTINIYTDNFDEYEFINWTGSGYNFSTKAVNFTMPNRSVILTANYTEIDSEPEIVEIFCDVFPFHFEENETTATLKLDCDGQIEYIDVDYSDFQYKLSNGTDTIGLNYSNNVREKKYECNSVWNQIEFEENIWNTCVRNEYGLCSGFPREIWIEGVEVLGTEVDIKLWKTNETPYNLTYPTLDKGYHVELKRERTPNNLMQGASCSGTGGTEVVYEAPIYKGYVGEIELHPCEIGKNDPVTIPDGSILFDAIDWGGDIVSYHCEHVMYFVLEGGTNGVMRNFGRTENWNIIPNSVTLGIFGDGIEVIGDYAFRSDNFEKLYLPDTLTSINRNSFQSANIKKLTIPNSVTYIGNYAFLQNAITELDLGTGIEVIDTGAFSDNKIAELTIPNSLTTLALQAFMRNEIETVYIGNGLTSLGRSAFQYNQLTEIHWGSSLFNIGNYAFANNNLTSVTFPNHITTIRFFAFEYNKLETVTFTRTDNTNSYDSAFRLNGPNSNSTAAEISNVNTNLFGTWTLSPDGTSWSR